MIRKQAWLPAGAILVLALLAAYHNSFSGPFVLDDIPSIPENPTLRHGWAARALFHPPATAGVAGRPVLNLTFALNYAASGLDVRSYHVLNLIIHALAALTLFGLVRRTLLQPVLRGRFGAAALPLALATALLWSLHPVQTASVTYLSQRAESLMGLFYLLTLYSFVRSAEEPAGADGPSSARRLSWAALAALSCLLGMATKEVMATAPLMVLLYDRVFVAPCWREVWSRRRWLHAALLGTWIALGALLAGLGGRGAGYGLGFTGWSYARTECWVVVRYLGLAVWPHPLVFDYGFNPVSGPVGPSVVALAGLAGLALAGIFRWPRAGFAGVWFFVILAPTSSVVPVAYDPMAENRLYLPLAGVVVLAVVGVHALLGRRAWVVLAAAAAGCGWMTERRNLDYRSDVALWRDTVDKCPHNARAHNNLGGLLADLPGRQSEAMAEYRAALQLKDDYPEAHTNYGNALAQLPGRLPEAIAQYGAALRFDPYFAEAHNNLGGVLAGIPGRREEALAEIRRALQLKPGFADAHYNLAVVLEGDPARLPEAIAEYRMALRLKPDDAGTHKSLGNALMGLPGGRAEAVEQYRAAVSLDPEDPGAHVDLANALVHDRSRLPEAIVEYQAGLRLDPDDPKARNNLGRALSEIPGRLSEAVSEYRAALKLRPDYAEARFNLGVALSGMPGRRSEAVAQLLEALRLRPDMEAARKSLERLQAAP